MAQAATRRRSAVRRQHAAHPNHPQPASKPGTPASAGPGGRRRRDHPDAGTRDRDHGRADEGRADEGRADQGRADQGRADAGGEGRLAGTIAERTPGLPEISIPRPRLPKPHLSIWTRLVGRILKKIAKHELRHLTKGANWSLESVAGEELDELKGRLGAIAPGAGMLGPPLPIQEAVDVAVPLHFAWSEWMELRALPEGVDRVVELERDGSELTGAIAGAAGRAWSAEVLDERDLESFAWKSNAGSDCAGLVTFHSLGERLTRIELTLDVLPHDPTESALLLTHLAHRRARRELRRFKADLELVSPDVYAGDERPSSR